MHVSGRAVVSATAAGVLTGVFYAASPLTLWIVAATAVLLRVTTRGLAPHERRAVWAIVGVAMALRAASVVVLFLTGPHDRIVSFFWDGDGLYFKQRADVIAQLWAGVPMGPYDVWEAFHRSYGWSSYIYVLAYAQYLLGAAPYAVHVLNAALCICAAVLLYRLARASYGPNAALLGLAVTLFLPTLLSWSVAALKESLYIALEALAIVGFVAAVRANRVLTGIGAALVCIAALAAVGTVRSDGPVIIAGIAAGVVATLLAERPRLLLPLVLVVVVGGASVWRTTTVPDRAMAQLKRAAITILQT